MQNYIENEKEYREYLKNKNIIIVGPAQSLEGKGLGKEIDSYDIIVRLNNSYSIFYNKNKNIKNDVGSRTDVLYHTGAIGKALSLAAKKYKIGKLKLLRKDKIKWFVSKRDPLRGTDTEKKYTKSFEKIAKGKIKFVTVHNKFLKSLRQLLKKTDPNMSTLAIIHLLKFNFKKLKIVGCDFYGSGYNKAYFVPPALKYNLKEKKFIRKDGKPRRKPKIPHDYKIQIRFLLRAIKKDKRVILDKEYIEMWKGHLLDD
jgi:hypothetical protein